MSRPIRKTSTAFPRRQLLAAMGCAGVLPFSRFNPLDTLLRGLMDGLIARAQADTLPSSSPRPRNYIYLELAGGPARWYFDQVLSPYASPAGLVANPMVNTAFGPGPDAQTAGAPFYSTVPIKKNGATLYMPALWANRIPVTRAVAGGTQDAGGMWAPMSHLLDNMATMRGIDMAIPGHSINAVRQTRPDQGAPSLHGLVADASGAPIPSYAGAQTHTNAYKSKSGIGQIVGNPDPGAGNGLAAIFGSFDRTGDGQNLFTDGRALSSRRAMMDQAIGKVLAQLGQVANSRQPGASALYDLRSRAESLLKAGVGDAKNAYPALVAKYSALIQRCATDPILGVTDRVVRLSDYTGDGGSKISIANGSSCFARNSDLRQILTSNSAANGLAGSFAVAEYLVLHGYSSSVMVGSNSVDGLEFSSAVSALGAPAGGTSWSYDEHFGGAVMSLIINSFNYRAHAACIYELIGSLGAGFPETVIHLGAEFSRSPAGTANGSGHGEPANLVTLWSGAINGPYFFGNTQTTPASDPAYGFAPGDWGYAAPVKIDGSALKLTIGNATSTVASLLRVTRPMANSSPVFTEKSGGGIEPAIELARNVPASETGGS